MAGGTGIKVETVGPWKGVNSALAQFPKATMAAWRKASLRESHNLRKEMIAQMKQVAPPAKSTMLVRRYTGVRGSKPLTVTGDLRNSIHITRMKEHEIFVGIMRNAKGRKGGGSMHNLAEIHEHGRTFAVPATPKSKRFLAKAFGNPAIINSKADFFIITIPARPFIGPAIKKTQSGMSDRISATVQHELSLLLSTSGAG